MFRKSNVQHTLLFTQRMPLFGQRTPSTASLSHSQIFGPSRLETGGSYQKGRGSTEQFIYQGPENKENKATNSTKVSRMGQVPVFFGYSLFVELPTKQLTEQERPG